MDVLRSAHNGLEDLLTRAQTVQNDVIEECGTGQDLSRAHSSVSHVRRVLADLEDVFSHAMLGVDSLVEAHEQHRLHHQLTQHNVIP